jgi:hypothetical protein
MVEVMLTTAMISVVVGSMAMVYSYTVARTSHAVAATAVSDEIQKLSDELDAVISQASSASVVTFGGNTGLRCTMPATQVDTNGDGNVDAYQPATMTGGSPTWGKGKRIWFYTADSTGDFTRPGPIVWRAERNDDLLPTAANADRAFAYYGSSSVTPRFGLIDQLSWVSNATDKSVTYTIRASSLTRAQRASASAYSSEKNVSETLTLTKNVFLRNWRQ